MSVDAKVFAQPGVPLNGLNGVRIYVADGVVDVPALVSSDLPMVALIGGLVADFDITAVPLAVQAGRRRQAMAVALGPDTRAPRHNGRRWRLRVLRRASRARPLCGG